MWKIKYYYLGLLLMGSTSSLNYTKSPLQMLNSSLVIDIVRGLNERLDFQNFIFYISQRLHKDLETKVFLCEFWYAFPLMPVMVMVNNSSPLVGLVGTNSLCVIVTDEWNAPVMDVAALSLKSVHYFHTLILFAPLRERGEDLEELYEHIRLLYEWVWQQQFSNTLLITLQNNIFIYEPFPEGRLVNKSHLWKVEDFFRSDKLDLRQREVYTPIRYDLPRVFYYRDKDITDLTGTAAKLFQAFITFINGSMQESIEHEQEHEMEANSIGEFIKMVESKELDISIHSYTSMTKSTVGTSYPIGINDLCFMVPFRNSSPDYIYFQKSLEQDSWCLLAFSLVYITMCIWLSSPSLQRDMTLALIQAISCLLLLPPLRPLTQPFLRIRLLFVLLFVLGFCFTNIYVSNMASFLTTAWDEPQIDSIQDIIDAKLEIMVLNFEYNILMQTDFSPQFLNLVKPVTTREMDRHRDHLNTSYGYSVHSDMWRFLDKQQSFLKKPLFRRTSICLGPFYHVFPLQKDSYLKHPLKDFILYVSQAGFIFFWESQAFRDALFLGYVQIFHYENEFRPLNFEFYRSIFIVWTGGLLLALIVYVWEIMAFKMPRPCLKWFRRF